MAAFSGALALSALAVPAAQADGSHGDNDITKVVVNGGKNVVVGATTAKTLTGAVTATEEIPKSGASCRMVRFVR
ncbi:hypothetical protein ACODT5_16260 [Streptomyces sp. 5.8]|uniref:hypothetical protein n=1 Tax=Streptomyces sp. 5.8 TaxID=3406571 RepID=UPI003BB80FA3